MTNTNRTAADAPAGGRRRRKAVHTITFPEYGRLLGIEDLARELVDRWRNGTITRPEAEIIDAMEAALTGNAGTAGPER